MACELYLDKAVTLSVYGIHIHIYAYIYFNYTNYTYFYIKN